MAITDTDAVNIIGKVLGGTPTVFTETELANQAGRELMNARRWRWADGAMVQLSLTASQAYITLPSDFHAFIGEPWFTRDATNRSFRLTTHEYLSMLRGQLPDDNSGVFHGVVVYDRTAGGVPAKRLELHPTPDANASNVLNAFYRRSWAAFPDPADGTEAILPEELEMLYIEFLQAVALGWENSIDNPGRRQEYLATVHMGPTWKAATSWDGTVQPTLGRLRNGYTTTHHLYYDRTDEVTGP